MAVLIPILAGCAPTNQAAPLPPGPPRRIVSMNPCVDAVLREVAEAIELEWGEEADAH